MLKWNKLDKDKYLWFHLYVKSKNNKPNEQKTHKKDLQTQRKNWGLPEKKGVRMGGIGKIGEGD